MTAIDKGALIMLCVIIIFIIIFLSFILLLTKKKGNESETEKKIEPEKNSKLKHGMPYEDIKKFLPFDDIKDSMIVQEQGERFTMLVECEGINYDLMSDAEKIGVEEGFIQFLNSIRFPIQIYIQSRTINLDESLAEYNKMLDKQNTEFNRLLSTFENLDQHGASNEKLLEIANELEKKEKVLDYTKDLIDNVSYLTQNSNILQKKYYIAISYHVSELGIVNNFNPDETYKLAYTELRNRAESVKNGIYSCGIEAEILDTSKLIEVIYIAVNRDDADIFSIKKVVDSDILSISTTSRDVMFKKQELAKEERRAREKQEEKERKIIQKIEEEADYYNDRPDASTML